MDTILFKNSILAILLSSSPVSCGAGATSPVTPQSTPANSSPVRNQSGTMSFPTSSGSTAVASYSLSAAPPSGTTLSLNTQVGSVGVPPPQGRNAVALVTFFVATNQSLQFTQFPAWQVTPPTNSSLSGPYGVEVFDGDSYIGAYTATVSNGTISAPAFGASFAATAGHNYAFEIVQNPALSQFPH